MSVRTAGKRGRLPAKTGSGKLAIGWVHSYLTQPLPAPVYPVDVSGGITEWGMDGNDRYGDCTFAARLHYQLAKAAAGREPPPGESTEQLILEYFRYDHGQDIGANIADLLLFWYRAGRILAFAPVDHTDPVAVDSAMAAFHGAYCGVDLTDDADELFQQGKPWTVASGQQPDPSDGHAILKVTAQGYGDDGWVTWGALQRSTPQWTQACLREAWAIVTEEDARAANLDIARLRADIDALHGTAAPGPKHAQPHVSAFLELADDVETALKKARAYFAAHGII